MPTIKTAKISKEAFRWLLNEYNGIAEGVANLQSHYGPDYRCDELKNKLFYIDEILDIVIQRNEK